MACLAQTIFVHAETIPLCLPLPLATIRRATVKMCTRRRRPRNLSGLTKQVHKSKKHAIAASACPARKTRDRRTIDAHLPT
jgi:hypothetical protein